MPASAITDIFYITRRSLGITQAFVGVDKCLCVFTISPVDRSMLERARQLQGNDFEDNVQIAAAIAQNLDAIVTRDPAGFSSSPLAILSPEALLERLRAR